MRIPLGRSSLWTRADSHAIGVQIRRLTLARTARGVDVTGRRFKPLRDGRPATLKRTGRLLGSLRVEAGEREVRVIATADYAPFVEEQGRPFLGVAPDELAIIDAAVLDRLAAREAATAARWRARPRS